MRLPETLSFIPQSTVGSQQKIVYYLLSTVVSGLFKKLCSIRQWRDFLNGFELTIEI